MKWFAARIIDMKQLRRKKKIPIYRVYKRKVVNFSNPPEGHSSCLLLFYKDHLSPSYFLRGARTHCVQQMSTVSS